MIETTATFIKGTAAEAEVSHILPNCKLTDRVQGYGIDAWLIDKENKKKYSVDIKRTEEYKGSIDTVNVILERQEVLESGEKIWKTRHPFNIYAPVDFSLFAYYTEGEINKIFKIETSSLRGLIGIRWQRYLKERINQKILTGEWWKEEEVNQVTFYQQKIWNKDKGKQDIVRGCRFPQKLLLRGGGTLIWSSMQNLTD